MATNIGYDLVILVEVMPYYRYTLKTGNLICSDSVITVSVMSAISNCIKQLFRDKVINLCRALLQPCVVMCLPKIESSVTCNLFYRYKLNDCVEFFILNLCSL